MADKLYLDFVGLNTFIYEPTTFIDADVGLGVSFIESMVIADGGSPTNVVIAPTDHTENFSLGAVDNVNFAGALTLGAHSSGKYSHHITKGVKNFLFPLELPDTASYFCALMIHRNGPYGYPTWKQIRAGQNPLSRRHHKVNAFTHIEEPGPTLEIEGALVNKRYGNLKTYVEVPVISRYKPVSIRGASVMQSQRTGQQSIERFNINSSFGNNLAHFNNEELDKYYGFVDTSDEAYDSIKELYLNDGLDAADSPMDIFEFVKYSETIYPTQLYTNKNYTRQRTTFSFNWRDDRTNRTEATTDNGFGHTIVSQSVWPLDVPVNWGQNSEIDHQSLGLTKLSLAAADCTDTGILQNQYSFAKKDLPDKVFTAGLNNILGPALMYNRRHTLTPSASVVSPNGMLIEGINTGTTFGNIPTSSLFAGTAKWEAGDQSGKNPFYDSYDDYVQGVRQRGKGYTIVPEFRISNHIPTLVAEGIDKKFTNMFEMVGGLTSADGSDEESFYKIYSTSEFLKHFDVVKEDHKGFVDPRKIKLKCKAIKKFLPYNGFYPCQRTTEIAQQFYSSHGGGVTVATGSTFDFQPLEDVARIPFQNILAPMFAPGVLFNSIKSGIACDYPITTGSITIANKRIKLEGDSYYLDRLNTSSAVPPIPLFDKRVPFRALIEPQRYISQQPLFCNEPNPKANHSSSAFWDGSGDNLYKMMTHNFLAEVPDFFLQGQQFSTIYSKPSSDANVGNAISGSTYKMRVKMYKTINAGSKPIVSSSGGNDGYFIAPQYSSDVTENFTMYSRPTAFGPPNMATNTAGGFLTITGSNSAIGENYPFTPPYYYGQAWADIEFTATETKKYTIDEIIRNSGVRYFRYVDNDTAGSGYVGGIRAALINDLYNDNAMQLDASLSLFAQGEIKSVDLLDDTTSDKVNVAVDVSSDKKSRWIIQPHFETPMLNFNHLSASTSITLPTYGSQSVPRGMWHQYGRIETNTDKGIFLEVTDVPDDFRIKISGSIFDKSLKDLCGFKDEPKRLGQVAQSKIISEAVVAIPFIEEEGQRKFFKLDPNTIDFIKRARSMAGEGPVGQSVLDMVDKMRKFVIPPSFDFVHRSDIEPFAMYIFEFKHTLSQQDLADIWQNLPPTVGRSFEEAEASISHDLLAHELLGGGETIIQGNRKKGPSLPDKIQWMVFKAKQRAKTNYYNKIIGEQDKSLQQSFEAASILRPEGVEVDMSYNWPYDFFSLVELVSLDAEVTLADTETIRESDNDIVLKRGRKAIEGLPPRAQSRIQQRNETTSEDVQEAIESLKPGGFFR